MSAGAARVRRDAAPFTLRFSVAGARDPALPARATLRRWVRLALALPATRGAPQRRRAGAAPAEISLAFVDGRTGRRLNREFRGRDYATNVLTFAYQRQPSLAADIVICLPVLRREAREQGKTLRQHLAHLLVHGVLHAQGYDHVRDKDARVMQARESTLLAQLRIPDPYA
jgi:probable rRNA maturation factor